MTDLMTVRRFVAASARAWPAASVFYDGAWAIRLTPYSPSKRLNSICPLDPYDSEDIDRRLREAGERFNTVGWPIVMNITPLAAPVVSKRLDQLGWARLGDAALMRLSLTSTAVDEAVDQIPLKDAPRFAAAAVATRDGDAELAPGLAKVIETIEPEVGLFVLEQDEAAVATAVCVHHGDLAGLFWVGTASAERGKGFGRRLVLSALKWARSRGAQTAWLQAETENEAATRLYESLGFRELYRHHYRKPPDAAS